MVRVCQLWLVQCTVMRWEDVDIKRVSVRIQGQRLMPCTFHSEGPRGQVVPFGFFENAGIREIQGFLHSRWSVEMTGIGGGVLSTTVVETDNAFIALPVSFQEAGR